MHRVSIILACYNVERFIDDALRSIVAQSAFDQFEVIPVNDGSTDRTWEIIQDYQRRYPNNFFPINFEKGSGGPGRPRNTGLDKARGEYVIFMDPDDRIYKDGYSTLFKAIEKHQSDIVIGTRYGVPEKQGPEAKVWVDFLTDEEYFNQDTYAIKLDLLTQRPVILKSIYRKSLMDEHNLRFLDGISSSEDEIFDMKYLLLSKRITKIHDVVYLYTAARTGSITSKIRLKLYEDLPVIFAGLDDALATYFKQEIISFRLASLLRTFYYPKLLLLDPELTDDALETVRRACDGYGFDKLLLTENSVDRRMLELLRDRKYSQLVLYFMNQRLSRVSRTVRNQNKLIGQMKKPLVKLGWRAFNYAQMTRRSIREGAPQRVLAANIRRMLVSQPNGYWLFMDRRDKGGDNGEALYRYVRDQRIHDRIAFIISEDCPDYKRLQHDGFNLIPYNTVKHWRLLYNCEHFFASHIDDVIIMPWNEYTKASIEPQYKLNFLQHGIIGSDLSGWLGKKRYNVFCSSSPREYEALINNIRYKLTPETLKLTGLARHDLLERRQGNAIVVAPTWRSFLATASATEFKASEFYVAWHELVYSDKIRTTLEENGLHIALALHPSLAKFSKHFPETDRVKVLSYKNINYAELISNAQMLVTDYSTISFDALYLRRPVLYYTFSESSSHSTNLGRDFALYQSLALPAKTHDEAVDAIVTSIGQDFTLDDEKISNINQFFAYSDNGNRKRIIDAVLQKEQRA